jgi:hypothetical protein
MTTVIKHALRAAASFHGGYRPEGWSPKLKVDLRGPSPAGAQLVWTVTRPDGSAWIEHTVDAPELAEDATETVELQSWEDGVDIDEPGTAAFTLRLVSELDGVDEPLHEGSLNVVQLEGDHVYAADNDWFLALAHVCLDTVDESDGPRLKVTTFLKGPVDAYQVEAHCFHDGTRGAQASDVSTGYTFTSNDGTVIGQEIVATFDDVRGWNNLTDQGWGEDSWHVLSGHDGGYEIKFLREKKVARVVPFTVTGGRIDAPGAVESDRWTGPVIIVDATIEGDADGDHDGTAAAFYGDATTAAQWASIDDVYAPCTQQTTDKTTTDTGDQTVTFDEDAVQAYFDRMERLLQTWCEDMETREPPYDQDAMLQAEAVLREKDGFAEKKVAAEGVPDDHAVTFNGEETTIGAMATRTEQLFVLAQKRLDAISGGADDAVAPFEAALANDKLAVMKDHSPPADYRYQTLKGKVMETPEELAEAEYWFFEGVSETKGKGTVDGTEVDVTVEGWRVLGWHFDAEGNTLDEWEVQGTGSNAPKSAFEAKQS